jgi:hypothetical protein
MDRGYLFTLAGFGMIAIHWLVSGVLVDRLRDSRPALFEQLGRPNLFSFGEGAKIPFWAWVFSAQAHAESGGILSLVWALRLLTIAVVGLFIVSAV